MSVNHYFPIREFSPVGYTMNICSTCHIPAIYPTACPAAQDVQDIGRYGSVYVCKLYQTIQRFIYLFLTHSSTESEIQVFLTPETCYQAVMSLGSKNYTTTLTTMPQNSSYASKRLRNITLSIINALCEQIRSSELRSLYATVIVQFI